MSAPSFIDRLSAAHQSAAASLPGAAQPEVTARRQAALDSFRRHGLPTARLEAWKFTSLTGLERQVPPQPANEGSVDPARVQAATLPGDSFRLVFVNGRFDAAASKLAGLPKGVRLLPLSQAGPELPAVLASAGDDRATSLAELNAAFASDGLLLQLDDGVALDRPVELVAFGAPALVNLRHLVRLGHKAEATLVESYRDAGSAETGWNNIAAGIELAEGAKLTHIRLQGESAATYHAALGRVSVGAQARYAHVSVQAGGRVARHELQVEFAGRDAEVDIQGLVLARGSSHVDHTLRLHHAVPDCRSNQLFKHVVDDQGHAVFQGGIRVAPHAQKTDAQQLSRTLLLADRAQIDTKPELEILADDVKCSHGASIGDVDAQQLFYMQARGISVAEARRLLLSGFAYEVVSAVPEGALRDHVEAFVEAWLVQEKDGQA
ncbi:Fe-S cluster assembly protein SufD [Ferrovibrio sp.]|uniref:Fe-S cluster assembly protein SufD n=1 Tax=Ferrovibrio sp. TaxID=1917215 RepID=UPI0026016F3A|nr:Fe-S cluster assembly protein SufD [Ferrovibrio sp.]